MEPVLLRVQEAAQLLNVSKWTVYRWIEEGRLQATKIGRGSLRVFRHSLTSLVDGARTSQASQDLQAMRRDGRGKTARGKESRRK